MKKTIKELELELQKEKGSLAKGLEKVVKMQAGLDEAKKAEATKKALAEKAKAKVAKKAAKLDRFILGYNDEDKVEVKPVFSTPPPIINKIVEDEVLPKEEKTKLTDASKPTPSFGEELNKVLNTKVSELFKIKSE